jgi:hypothetical protein
MSQIWTNVCTFFSRCKVFLIDASGLVILALTGFLYFEKSQKDKAQAEVKNAEDQKKIDGLTQDQSTNDSQMDVEAQKRAELEKQLQEEQNVKSSQSDILKYFNDPNFDK